MLLISSLRARILLLLLAVVLPMLCVVSYSFYEQRQNMVRTLEQEMTTDARILAGVMAQKVDGARGLLSALAYSPSIYNRDSVGCNELLAHIFNENSQYTNLGVAAPDGNVFCSALPMTKPVNVLDRTWFQRTVKNPDIAFGNYQIGRIVGKPVMIMAHAARSESGEVQAAIFVPFDLDQLAKIPEQIKRPWNIEFLILDRNGTILAHDPDQDKWVGKTAGESSLIKTILTRHAGVMETKGIDGITQLYAFIPVTGTDNSIFVSIGVSRDVYLADTNRIFIRNLIILSVIIVLSFAVAILISRLAAKAEEKLVAGAEQFRDLYDNAPNGYLSFGTDGLIKRCNKRMSELLEYETEKLLGLPVVNLYADVPDGKEKANKLFQRFLSGETIFDEEIQLRKADGMAVWMSLSMNAVLDAQGQVLEGRAIIQDITERKQVEAQIVIAKEQWEKTFDAMPEIITIQDKDMRIVRANKAAHQLFQAEPGELKGKHCYEVFTGVSAPCSGCPVVETLQDKKEHSAIISHENLGKIFDVSSATVTADNGEIEHIVHVAKNITELKQMEEHLRQAQKMEAIGTLAGGIAHDFNNILTPILGYSEMVAEGLPEGSEEREMVLDIRTAGKRATELVKQILTFSRQSEQQRQPLQIHLVIKEALKLLRSSIPTTIAIHQNVVDCGLVMADPTQVHQIIMNLCTNAYHAMQQTGGELDVSMEVVELTTQDYLDNLDLQPGPHVKLNVRDTGCGMSKELVERIFDPYFTTKQQGEGTGLGLSVVHGIVESHHGHITVYSEPGKGTEFHVYLPQVQGDDEGLAKEAAGKILQGSGTILVVDDEPSIGEMLKMMLSNMGYEVLLCSSSTEALAVFTQQRARIALVLTDMNMPVMNGAELARRIKQLSPVMPVVLCTGFSEIMDKEKARRMGIDGYMMKPVIQRQLAQTLHDVLEKKGGSGPAV